jgi:NADH-quinone oxidoreductase subunit M
LSIIITAGYILLVVRRVFFGQMSEKLESHVTPITVLDKIAIGTLCLFMILLGLFPAFMVPLVDSGVKYILDILEAA